MADVSKIKLPNGTTYNIKDTVSGYTTNTGTITKVQTTAGAHTTINVSSGAAAFNVPTKTSHLMNDSGFITNAGVTGVKGNAESSYRTGQVNLTAANIGAVSLSGNETISGDKTFSGTTEITPTSTFTTTNGVVIPASPTSIIQSPIPKYLWHDIWAFCRARTPQYYISNDGSTWTEATLEKRLFSHQEMWGQSIVLDSSIKGSRWEWKRAGFYASMASWLVLGITYRNPSAHFDVLLETSEDGTTWTTLTTATDISYVQTPIWIKNNTLTQDSIRLTITWNSNSASNATLGLCSIRFLTHRWGNQGQGSEYEYPYTWDSNYNISPLSGSSFIGNLTGNVTGNVSGSASSVAWTGVTGKPSSTGNSTTGISIAAHGTGTVIGVQSTTTTASKVTVGSSSTDYGVKSAGSASTWTFEEKTIPNVTATGSGSASLTFAMDTTDTKKLKITFSHTHTAPTIGTAIKVQSKSGGSNGTAPTLGSKVPTVSASDVTVPIKNTSASTFVTGTTHTVTDNGHTHTI